MKTFDELKRGDLVLCAKYDQHDKVVFAKVYKLRADAVNEGKTYDDGTRYVRVQCISEFNDLTLPIYRNKYTFEQKNERTTLVYQVVNLTSAQAADVSCILLDTWLNVSKQISGSLPQPQFDALSSVCKHIDNERIKANLIADACEYYATFEQIKNPDGTRRKDVSADAYEMGFDLLQTLTCTYTPARLDD